MTISPAADFATDNDEVQQGEPRSMLALYRALLELRRREPALAVGGYAPVAVEGPLLAYRRWQDERRFLIVLNLGSAPAVLELPATSAGGRTRAASGTRATTVAAAASTTSTPVRASTALR